MGSSSGVCVCGHERETHKHYRRGTDCGVCGAVECPRFRRDPHAGSRRSPSGRQAAADPDQEIRVEDLEPST